MFVLYIRGGLAHNVVGSNRQKNSKSVIMRTGANSVQQQSAVLSASSRTVVPSRRWLVHERCKVVAFLARPCSNVTVKLELCDKG